MSSKKKNINSKSENGKPQRPGPEAYRSEKGRSEEEFSRDLLSRMEIPARPLSDSWRELQQKIAAGGATTPERNAAQETGSPGNEIGPDPRSGNFRHRDSATINQRPAMLLHRNRPLLLVAASLLLLLSITAFLRYHTKTVATGAHTIALALPDGSEATLYENSKASWHPLWWRFNTGSQPRRRGALHREKGKKFTVTSAPGTTEVLGTTFRVTARSEIYRVACYEGSVKVTGAGNTVSATLTAFEQVIIHKDGRYSITLIEDKDEETLPAEAAMPFEPFRSVPAEEVFGRIADHYGITIRAGAAGGLLFSGNLQFNGDPEKLLNAVCLPLELRYEKTGDNEFVILDDNR
jgi:transmembrane sensor